MKISHLSLQVIFMKSSNYIIISVHYGTVCDTHIAVKLTQSLATSTVVMALIVEYVPSVPKCLLVGVNTAKVVRARSTMYVNWLLYSIALRYVYSLHLSRNLCASSQNIKSK